MKKQFRFYHTVTFYLFIFLLIGAFQNCRFRGGFDPIESNESTESNGQDSGSSTDPGTQPPFPPIPPINPPLPPQPNPPPPGDNGDLGPVPKIIPRPSFGLERSIGGPPTHFVDSSNPNCDDGQERGTLDRPLCDIFKGGSKLTLEAGSTMVVRGGPYRYSSSRTVTSKGTASKPVVIVGIGVNEKSKVQITSKGKSFSFRFDGSYLIAENFDFYDNVRLTLAAKFMGFRFNEAHQPNGYFADEGFNPIINVTGNDVLLFGNHVYDNLRRGSTSEKDTHGIQAGQGSYNVWLLQNELHHNNGDSFQSCHNCTRSPAHHVYIAHNTMYSDRENAVDLKSVRDVIVTENVMYGYLSSGTSIGDAVVVGSTGFNPSQNQGPDRILIINNLIYDSETGLRVEGAGEATIQNNIIKDVGTGFVLDIVSSLDIKLIGNTVENAKKGIRSGRDCGMEKVLIKENTISLASDLYLELAKCFMGKTTVTDNKFIGNNISTKIDGSTYKNANDLNSIDKFSGNVFQQ